MIAEILSPPGGRPGRCLGIAGPIAITLLLVLTSCSSDDDNPPVTVSSSPPLSAPSGATLPSQSPASPKDAVTAGYRGYWQATRQAATVPLRSRRPVRF